MNCEDYEKAKAEDPALERKIARALEIDVPQLQMPELPSIDTGNVTTLQSRRVSAPTWFALAATVVIAAFLGIRMFGSDVTYPSLADEIVAHLDHEPYALRVTDKAVSDRRLASVVPASLATMNHDAGLITYAQSCVINGKKVPHLVIQGEHGPVTILLMPEEAVDAAVEIEGESINGVILPVGNGSIAIIGEEEERLETIQESVKNSVTWST